MIRHYLFLVSGEFTGEYEGHTGDGELLEMIGFARVSVTDELKITDINVFYKPEDFLRALQGKQAGKLEEAEEKKNVEIFLENLKTQKSTFKLEINGIEADNNLVERFQTGFHADAIEIYSESAFSWSHQLSKSEGENDLAGFAILDRDESGKMTEIKVFYKPRDIAKESLEEMGLL